ncbi:pectate lyase [Peristeroidobacter agariperforans]|uniref:pectate lyase n=1 Tax=Peristeroidobacter agariperforans TaxID=268404 RepID=UPI00101D866A|nr:pectate lyase [Peristeroidobacter agariperforans]
MLRKLLVGGLLLASAASAWSATNRPEGYVTICRTPETCSVSASTNVAFGASGQFVYKVLNGTFTCTVATFGSDPIPEKSVKECSVPSGGGTTPPPTGSTISLSASAGNGTVSLSWSYSSGSGATQEVYRDLDADPNGRVRIASVSSSTRSYTDSGLTNGTTYYYTIKNTASGVATNSNVASATPSGGGTTPPPTGSITGSSCSTSGAQTTVNETIRVTSGTYDGGCQRFNAGSGLGDGSQSEGQDPVFRVENGATLRNVVIGNNGADGIHTYNGANLDNIYWMNVGEDAMTIKSSGTTTVSNIEGYDADDKFFQVNAASTLNVTNCIIHRAGKALRQNGGTTFQINVSFNRCDINTMKEGVFRTDSSSSRATLTNSRLHDAGTVCIGSWASCTQSGNSSY